MLADPTSQPPNLPTNPQNFHPTFQPLRHGGYPTITCHYKVRYLMVYAMHRHVMGELLQAVQPPSHHMMQRRGYPTCQSKAGVTPEASLTTHREGDDQSAKIEREKIDTRNRLGTKILPHGPHRHASLLPLACRFPTTLPSIFSRQTRKKPAKAGQAVIQSLV